MRLVQIDTPYLLIAGKDHPDLLGRLDEEIRLRATEIVEAGNARHRAARSRRKADLAGDHLVVVLLHALLHPGFQVRMGEVGNPIRRLDPRPPLVGDIGIFRIVGHRGRPAGAGDGKEVAADADPPIFGKVGRSRVLLRRNLRRQGNEGRHDRARETLCPRRECGHGSNSSSCSCSHLEICPGCARTGRVCSGCHLLQHRGAVGCRQLTAFRFLRHAGNGTSARTRPRPPPIYPIDPQSSNAPRPGRCQRSPSRGCGRRRASRRAAIATVKVTTRKRAR